MDGAQRHLLIIRWSTTSLLMLATILFYGAAAVPPDGYTFLHEATTSPPKSYYDYIIIGGGTSGCPLATTLSQNYTVLLLERGHSPYNNPNITNLSAFGAPLSDTTQSSPSQRFVSTDGVINARARVLGGGSCLNAGFYTRASVNYVESVARWDGNLVNESYQWVEQQVAFKPVVKAWQSAVRDALVEVGVTPYNGFSYDHINGTKVGGTIFDERGHRHTAADLLQYGNRENLTVLLHAVVHRIMFRKRTVTGGGRKRAYGVVFYDANGRKHKAYVRRSSLMNEIIVSAGALGSPQLLMLSGLGPKAHLRAHNISVVRDHPFVGQGMADNPMNAVFVPSPKPVEVSLIQVVGITPFGSFIEAASGENFPTHHPTSRDFGIFFSTTPFGQMSTISKVAAQALQGGFLLEKIEGPISTGHLELTSRDPNDNPTVTFNYFKEREDLHKCVQGMRTIEKIISSKAFAEFKYNETDVQTLLNMTANSTVNMIPRHNDDNSSLSLEQFCKDTVMTIWHYHGGCQVGKVVDRDYKVLGVDGLRVIDGSTFGASPGTNPQATVMMLGRYMGLRILRDRLTSDEDY